MMREETELRLEPLLLHLYSQPDNVIQFHGFQWHLCDDSPQN